MEDIYMLYLAFGVILGHNYPCYLNFKGGKGISSTSGFILAFDLRIAAVCLAAFSVIVGTTRYVSLGRVYYIACPNYNSGIYSPQSKYQASVKRH